MIIWSGNSSHISTNTLQTLGPCIDQVRLWESSCFSSANIMINWSGLQVPGDELVLVTAHDREHTHLSFEFVRAVVQVTPSGPLGLAEQVYPMKHLQHSNPPEPLDTSLYTMEILIFQLHWQKGHKDFISQSTTNPENFQSHFEHSNKNTEFTISSYCVHIRPFGLIQLHIPFILIRVSSDPFTHTPLSILSHKQAGNCF